MKEVSCVLICQTEYVRMEIPTSLSEIRYALDYDKDLNWLYENAKKHKRVIKYYSVENEVQ